MDIKTQNTLISIEAKSRLLWELREEKYHPQTLSDWCRLELAYTNTAIDGNLLDRRDVKLVIKNGMTAGSKPLNHYIEVKNHGAVYNYMADAASKNLPYEEVLKKLNTVLLASIDESGTAGQYRTFDHFVYETKTRATAYPQIQMHMRQLFDFLNNESAKIPVPLKAIAAHYHMFKIIPFGWANDQTARLFMSYVLMRAGHSPMFIRPRDTKDYLNFLANALAAEEDDRAAYAKYESFMLGVLERSYDSSIHLFRMTALDKSKLIKIGKLSKMTGVPIQTLHYYMKARKLKPALKTETGYALFLPEQAEEVLKLREKPLEPPISEQ